MAAFDVPWTTDQMASPKRSGTETSPTSYNDNTPTTHAAFAPHTLAYHDTPAKRAATILVHQKSPLLVSTPPQVTRALAYSHSFLLPLNKFVGLLSWTTGDPWESFLLVASFWIVTLYGDVMLRWAGPIIFTICLIVGMYSRRYSPMSSSGWTGLKVPRAARERAETDTTRHHKSLDDIVDTLRVFTARCNILLDPFLRLTDFLSTQSTATKATTRPALTTLFIRILMVTPIWFALTLPPLYIITTKRIVLSVGTVTLSWHSRPARISRLILWRSRLVRRTVAFITGLEFGSPDSNGSSTSSGRGGKRTANDIAASLAAKRHGEPGIRFTFAIYENQRRWIGLGWTGSMLAYERANWTDEHLNSSVSKDSFDLPEVEGGHAKWRWVASTSWHVEGSGDIKNVVNGSPKRANATADANAKEVDPGGWIYYDNKWRDGRRADGWGRYTRRRKWCRDAELVETTPSESDGGASTPNPGDSGPLSEADTIALPEDGGDRASTRSGMESSTSSTSGRAKKRNWFKRHAPTGSNASEAMSEAEAEREREREEVRMRRRDEGQDQYVVSHDHGFESREESWGLDDNARMGLS